MMAEKILGLLAAFVLGGVAGFFYLAHCLKFIVEHNLWGLRDKLRGLVDRYEPQYNNREPLFRLPSDRVEAVRAGYQVGQVQFHFDAKTIEQGLRAASGRCGQCGSPEDVRRTLGGPLCHACAEFWSMPP